MIQVPTSKGQKTFSTEFDFNESLSDSMEKMEMDVKNLNKFFKKVDRIGNIILVAYVVISFMYYFI